MLIIKDGLLPGAARPRDILIEDGRITATAESLVIEEDTEVINASGLIVAPGLVDMHVHFRDPGYTQKEDIMSGAAAAAAGGVTTCVCMPNTSPVIDNAEAVRYIFEKAEFALAPIRVLPYGAVTVAQKGKELTDFMALKDAGAVALSDDGNPIQSAAVMRRAMMTAREHDMLIVSHCEDAELARDYAVNEGRVSKRLKLEGRPAIAEGLMIARDVMLAKETGARLHIAHVSTAGSVDIIRRAKDMGVEVTAETCPQYFTLTEDAVFSKGSLARVNPPLRTKNDIAEIICGLADGTIDAIATDHAPHSMHEKPGSIENALSGMIGLETSLALALTFLYHTGRFSMVDIIRMMSVKPARILGLETGRIAEGGTADIVMFDPDEEWIVDPEKFKSKARNTPFGGMMLRGRVKYTICNGKVVYRGE